MAKITVTPLQGYRKQFADNVKEVVRLIPGYRADNFPDIVDYLYWRWLHTRPEVDAPTPAQQYGATIAPEIEKPTGNTINVCLENFYEKMPEIKASVGLNEWQGWWQDTLKELMKRGAEKAENLHENIIDKIRKYLPDFSMSTKDMERLDMGVDRVDLKKISEHMEFWYHFCRLVLYPLSCLGVMSPVWNDYEVFVRDAKIMLCMGTQVNLYDVFIEPDEVAVSSL